jgi:hypothetical protein
MEGSLNDPRVFSLYSFNTASLSDGQCIRFTPTQETEPPPAIEPISIPTMNVWGLLLFSALLAWVTARRFRSGKL